METAHGGEVVGEGFRVSGLQLLNQQLDVGGNHFLLGGRLLAVDGDGIGVGDGVHGVCSLGLAFALTALKRGMYMPNATWRRRGSKRKGLRAELFGGTARSVGEPKPEGRMALESAGGSAPEEKSGFRIRAHQRTGFIGRALRGGRAPQRW